MFLVLPGQSAKEEMLSVELSDLQDQSFGLSLLDFDVGELDKLLGNGNEELIKEIESKLKGYIATCSILIASLLSYLLLDDQFSIDDFPIAMRSMSKLTQTPCNAL